MSGTVDQQVGDDLGQRAAADGGDRLPVDHHPHVHSGRAVDGGQVTEDRRDLGGHLDVARAAGEHLPQAGELGAGGPDQERPLAGGIAEHAHDTGQPGDEVAQLVVAFGDRGERGLGGGEAAAGDRQLPAQVAGGRSAGPAGREHRTAGTGRGVHHVRLFVERAVAGRDREPGGFPPQFDRPERHVTERHVSQSLSH